MAQKRKPAREVVQDRGDGEFWLDHAKIADDDRNWLKAAERLTLWNVLVPDGFLAKLPRLWWLDLRGGSATDLSVAKGCTKLRYLQVNQVRGMADLRNDLRVSCRGDSWQPRSCPASYHASGGTRSVRAAAAACWAGRNSIGVRAGHNWAQREPLTAVVTAKGAPSIGGYLDTNHVSPGYDGDPVRRGGFRCCKARTAAITWVKDSV